MKLLALRILATLGLIIFLVSGFVTLFTGDLVWLTLIGGVMLIGFGLWSAKVNEVEQSRSRDGFQR